MTLVHGFEELAQALDATGTAHRAHPESREIEFHTTAGLPGNLVVKWEVDARFVSLRHLIAIDIPPARMAELEGAVTRVNHQMEVLGFNLDHLRNRLYYRLSVPAFDGIDSSVLNRLARGVVGNAMEFAASFLAVIGGRPGSEIAEIYKAFTEARPIEVG